jgi:hypothetical protein
MVQIMEFSFSLMDFVNVYIYFWIRTWIRIREKFRILADPDPQHCILRYILCLGRQCIFS